MGASWKATGFTVLDWPDACFKVQKCKLKLVLVAIFSQCTPFIVFVMCVVFL